MTNVLLQSLFLPGPRTSPGQNAWNIQLVFRRTDAYCEKEICQNLEMEKQVLKTSVKLIIKCPFLAGIDLEIFLAP